MSWVQHSLRAVTQAGLIHETVRLTFLNGEIQRETLSQKCVPNNITKKSQGDQ
jgi:hypothetical protein